MKNKTKTKRLEYLRGELRAERISYGELVELESLIPFISPDDVELLEAAGVPENQTKTEKAGAKTEVIIVRGCRIRIHE